MRHIREILRLLLTTDMSNRKIEKIIGKQLTRNSIAKYKMIVEKAGYDWPTIDKMDDNELEVLLKTKRQRVVAKRVPNLSPVHDEMHLTHVTLQLLWEEYCVIDPETAYSYSQFTHYYREYVNKLDVVMRQSHRAGEMVFVDFAGRKIPYTDPDTGEKHQAPVFVGVLGCSNYMFVQAVKSQSIESWIDAHNRMYMFFGGVPVMVVPDNLKSAVIRPGSTPDLNRTYLEQARHYNVVIVPARVRKPKDKAKAEVGVQLASRWVMAALRHRQFFSLEEINEAIAELLKQLNERPFKRLPDCRRVRFEQLDKPNLRPLPATPFEYAEWTSSQKVGPDYHVNVRNHYYSVPYALVGIQVEARITAKVVELFSSGKRVASHMRSDEVGGHTTVSAHQPKEHRLYAEQTPEKLLGWAKSIGASCYAVVQHQFDRAPHALVAIKACGPLQRLAKKYGAEKFEAACQRALAIGSPATTSIRSLLRRRLTEVSEYHTPIQTSLPLHQNLRGSTYYSNRSK